MSNLKKQKKLKSCEGGNVFWDRRWNVPIGAQLVWCK